MTLKIQNKSKFHFWRARMAASDPGLVRFNFAVKIVCSIFLACAIMMISMNFTSQKSLIPVILTGLIALQANVLVNDSTEKARKTTTYLFPLVSIFSITTAMGATLVSGYFADSAFVLTIFITFYLQKFGIRYFTLGLIAFLSFYFSLMYMPGITFPQILWYYTGILVAAGSAYLVNFVLLKENLGNRLKRSMSSYHIQMDAILQRLTESARDSKSNDPATKKSITTLRKHMQTVVNLFEIFDPGKVWPGTTVNQLWTYIYAKNMLIEMLFNASETIQDLEEYKAKKIQNILLMIIHPLIGLDIFAGQQRHRLDNLTSAVDFLSEEIKVMESSKEDHSIEADSLNSLKHVAHATLNVMEGLASIQQIDIKSDGIRSNSIEFRQKETEQNKEIDIKPTGLTLDRASKKGIQAAVASAIAILIGHLISPSFPYWIVLAVNMVILGTETTGRTIAKASERFIGTVTGAILGILTLQFIGTNPYVALTLVGISIFMAYYLMALSYSIFIFWVTLLITMAFQLMNMPGIEYALTLRVIDTLIGVLLGTLAAVFIMPHRTIEKAKDLMNEYVKDVRRVVDMHANSSVPQDDEHIFMREVILLDQKFLYLRAEANILGKWQNTASSAEVRKKLAILSTLNDDLKLLACKPPLEKYRKIMDTLKGIEGF